MPPWWPAPIFLWARLGKKSATLNATQGIVSLGLKSGRGLTVFFGGFVAGLVALAFNFLIRLAGLAAFPPEAALSAFLRVVPASIEEPMVQQLGGFAGELGVVIATFVAAVVYGLLALVFDRLLAEQLLSRSRSVFESVLVFSLVPWLFFGLVLFPLVGDSWFGISSDFVSSSNIWFLPLSSLLVQGVFGLLFAPRYAPVAANLPSLQSEIKLQGKSRREFIEKGTIVVLALIAGVIGLTSLGGLTSSDIQPSGGSAPIDLQDAPAIFSDPRLQTLVDSEVTPNNSFYLVDIDFVDPTVDASSWTLKVDGLVNTPKTYTLSELQNLPVSTQYTTLECVSNVVNGDLISNAKWTGLKISDLLQDVGGARTGAEYVVFYSVDGYSVGVPLAKAMLPDSMLAYSMNDLPLPTDHGYPLRGLIPGLYGMMSAKWVKEVAVVSDDYEGYWQTRGWTNQATINTVSFITTPAASQVSLSQNNGAPLVAGYTFAGDRGVSKVEVSFDKGATWQQAELKKPLSNLTWALWAYEWHPSKGNYTIWARATDGTGKTQTPNATQTFPNGATGYPEISVSVVD